MSDSDWKGLSEVIRDKLTEEALLNRPPKLKTGFDQLDRVLGGGLSPGLVVLGGVSNVGKSTFALQMAERLAEQAPVLYYALEMTGEYIGAKMLSRRLFQTARSEDGGSGAELLERIGETCASADEIISRAGGFSRDQWQRIAEARRYVEERAEELYVIETALSAQKIAGQTEEFMEDHPGKTPVVIVDYLQILPPENPAVRSERQAVDDSVRAMVGLARRGVTVLLISSLSRGTHEVRMDSFKESGSIEYSADVLLGLQFRACREPLKKGERFNDLREKEKVPREVEVAVLKQRYGECGGQIPLDYYSKYDCFEETRQQNSVSLSQDGGALSGSVGCEWPGSADAGLAETVSLSQDGGALPGSADGVEAGLPEADGGAAESDFGELRQADAGPENLEIPEEQGERDNSIPRSVMCNTKIANEIRRGVFGRENRCEVMKGVYTEFDLLPEALTFADCDVADAIYTLLSKYGRESFSAGQVLRVLSGDERQTLTAQKKRELTKSIERLRNTSIEIRCEEEMRERMGENGRLLPSLFQGRFLDVREEDGRYFFERGEHSMPLYAYGESTRQMISFPRALLQVRTGGRKLRDSAETVFVKRYLIRRLEILRNSQKNRKRDKDSDFRYISMRENKELAMQLRLSERFPSKELRVQKQRRLQASVLEILAHFQSAGYIQGYDYLKAVQSVKITGRVQNPWKPSKRRSAGSGKASENTDETQ